MSGCAEYSSQIDHKLLDVLSEHSLDRGRGAKTLEADIHPKVRPPLGFPNTDHKEPAKKNSYHVEVFVFWAFTFFGAWPTWSAQVV